MDYSEIKEGNPQLYYNGIARGKIPLSNENDVLQWGNPAGFLEGVLGGPFAPDNTGIVTPGDFATPPAFGESGNYPKPWRSFSQRFQNLNYSFVGPYAKMVKIIVDEDTCDPERTGGNKFPGIYGRWGYATSGPYSGQGAFYIQDWYNPSEGFYNAEYYNTQAADAGTPLDPEWQLRKDWWESSRRVTIKSRIANTGQACEIEVAIGPFTFGTSEYYEGNDLGVYADYSLDLLVVMVSIAAIARWL